MEVILEEELIEAAMSVILSAGEARDHCSQALKAAREGKFDKAEACMGDAKIKIANAHAGQTEVLQKEASGEHQKINLLFIHAQDTLMTIMSEINLSKELIETYKLIYRMRNES